MEDPTFEQALGVKMFLSACGWTAKEVLDAMEVYESAARTIEEAGGSKNMREILWLLMPASAAVKS